MNRPAQAAIPRAADLENPLYYLENMETVLGWVLRHHRDLLTGGEVLHLENFFHLSVSARALLTRMVMRTGDLFRADKLAYPELESAEADALAELAANSWLDSQPVVSLDELFRLFTVAELRTGFAPLLAELGVPGSVSKGRMRALLEDRYSEARSMNEWPGMNSESVAGAGQTLVVRVCDMALFDRIRLMFFGNLRQSWSDFVLVELGHQRFEQVTFSPESRAFHRRGDVDNYLAMHHCREQLDQGVLASEVWSQLPEGTDNPWLTGRRNRLLLELGRQAERQGDRELALQAFAAGSHREARLKQLRLLERMKRFEDAWVIAQKWQATADGIVNEAEAQGMARIIKRLAVKVGASEPAAVKRPALTEWTVTLPHPGLLSVEMAVQDYLGTDEAPVVYVENTLINGLFGLLCWQVIFEPVPGAFFHPFHVGPVDLTREDFVARRQAMFDRCFDRLDDGSYRQRVLDNWDAKVGIANPFVIWPALSRELLELAMDCIPVLHLKVIFQRLLANIREHRSGFPDLIRFYPQAPDGDNRFEMIEVKGPGDRLQDHQVRWLEFFAGHGIPASVCYVRWQDGGESASAQTGVPG